MLHGVAPLKKECQDSFRWDPSSSSYTIKYGYESLLKDHYPTPPWAIWKQIWKSEALPKVKIFTWIVLKGKILTSKKLKKEVSAALQDVPSALRQKRLPSISLLDAPLPRSVGFL